jgi:glycosyltransferase involved in cell wall biosynthesis
VWQWQPDVVHIHGWLTGIIAPYISLFTPRTTYIWTIDTLPEKYNRIIKWAVKNHGVYQAITTPTRQLQYQLLHRYNLRTTYIPDGYIAPSLSPLPAATFNLRKGQYCLAIVSGKEKHGWIVRAYKSIKGLKKPLVVITDAEKTGRRTKKIASFNTMTGRPLVSLLQQAAVVLFAEENPNPETVLLAMDASRPVIATTHPIYEETLGVTAQFIKSGDKKALKNSLENLLKNRRVQTAWGKKAAKRAQTFFAWRRSLSEYLIAYYAAIVRRVPIDSLHAKSEGQIASRVGVVGTQA